MCLLLARLNWDWDMDEKLFQQVPEELNLKYPILYLSAVIVVYEWQTTACRWKDRVKYNGLIKAGLCSNDAVQWI